MAGGVAVVVAHPDDETIGAGGRLPELTDVRIIHLTDGAPRRGGDVAAAGFARPEDYAAARRRELDAALGLAGIPAERAVCLGVPDQEASLHLAELAARLAELLDGTALVLTHPYEGGHPDHDATAFAVRAACRRLGGRAPVVVEMASYHGWGGGMVVQQFLPTGASEALTEIRLTAARRDLKRRMLACYTTQRATLAPFGVAVERFRSAPRYDFTRPPHPGPLLYEHYDWGMDGARWRRLAGEALAALGLDPCP